jgi:hypothetical protein
MACGYEFRYNYRYDYNDNIINNLFEYWSDSTWVTISRTIYNPETSQTSYLFQLWDNNTWIDNRQGLYEYDSERKLIFNTVKNWDGIEWVNYSRVTFNYDPNGNRELSLIEIWFNDQWINSEKISYAYNSDNYFTYGIYEIWKNREWVRGDGGISIENPTGYWLGFITCEIFVYYNSLTNVKEDEFLTSNYELFNNYPNPFNPATTVSWQSTVGSRQTLTVYDILGREIATLVDEYKPAGKYEIEFSAEDLSSGVYFYTIRAGDFSQTKKMILAK